MIEHPQDPDPLGPLIRSAPWFQPALIKDHGSPGCGQPVAASRLRPASPLGRQPLPPAVPDDVEVESSATEITIVLESRRWRIRNFEANTVPGILRVNLLVYSLRSERFHVDTFDLYHARSRRAFLAEAADELGDVEAALRADIGKVLLTLEKLQLEQRQRGRQGSSPKVPAMTDE